MTQYTTGQFAKKAKVTIRTIRYYDKQGILKPTVVGENGYRYYTDEDFVRLQKILSLKSLGFSLQEISDMQITDNSHSITDSLQMQVSLIQRKMEQFDAMKQALLSTIDIIQETNQVDWNQILKLIHLSNLERSLVEQYQNEANLKIRISLHEQYATNKMGWFPWIYQQIPWTKRNDTNDGMKLLELGCGNGGFWTSTCASIEQLPNDIQLYLTDISEGMIKDAKAHIRKKFKKDRRTIFKEFKVVDCERIPYDKVTFDLVMANHVLFYPKNVDIAIKEIARVLKPDGMLLCSTYGKNHMKEITELVQAFDPKITLSEVPLYEQFGLENGREHLEPYFEKVECALYEDELRVDAVEPLLQYILSCHGNQSDILSRRQEEFREFLQEQLDRKGIITITKEAGTYRCLSPIK